MQEFFKTNFGKLLVGKVEKIKGRQIYKIIDKVSNRYLTKGDLFYLDTLHFDHIEVFNASGKFKGVLNLDGTWNARKTLKAAGRRIDV